MESLIQDVRYSLRRLRESLGTTLVVVLTLGLCIGFATALLSIVRGVFLDPFPYVHHERIVYLFQNFPTLGRDEYTFSAPELADLGRAGVFEHVMAGESRDVNLTGGERAERVLGAAVTASTFEMLGVPALHGRVFRPDEDRPGGGRVVLLSHALWQRRFGSDPGIVGRTLLIEGQPTTVVGVMPPRFLWWGSEIWFPLQLDTTQSDRTARFLTIMARLRPGLTAERGEAELAGLARRLEGELGAQVPEYVGLRFHARSLIDEVIRNLRPALLALEGAVLVLLLVAAANVANILLAQMVKRERELAVRLAVGARPRRVARQVVVESLVLTLLGGLLGFVLSLWGARLMVGLIPYGFIPAETEVTVDVWAFVLTVGLALLVGLLAGLAPAFHLLRGNVGEALKQGARQAGGMRLSRARGVLVAAEVALGLALVIGAGLMLRSFAGLTAIDPGFDRREVLTLRVDLPEARYAEPARIGTFYDQLLASAGALPGAAAVGMSRTLPLQPGPVWPITIEGLSAQDAGGAQEAQNEVVAGDFFGALRIRTVRGRVFGPADSAQSPRVAVINEAAARRFFPDADPLGRRLKRGTVEEPFPWITIVGVVADVKQGGGLEQEALPAYYVPVTQLPVKPRTMAVAVRTARPPEAMAEAVRREIAALDPELPVYEVQTLDELVLATLGARRVAMILLGLTGGLALLLAALGVFAVMAHAVSQRTRELGVRLALGARPGQLFGLVIGQALRLVLLGVAAGLLLAASFSRLLASLVYGVGTRDPWTFAAVALLFVAVAVLASYLPARRATRVPPVVALREGG